MTVVGDPFHRVAILSQSMMRRAPYLSKGLILLGVLGAVLCAPFIGEFAEVASREAMEHGPPTRLWSIASLPVSRLSLTLLAGTLSAITVAAFLRARMLAVLGAAPATGVESAAPGATLIPPPRGAIAQCDDSSADWSMPSATCMITTPRTPERLTETGGSSRDRGVVGSPCGQAHPP